MMEITKIAIGCLGLVTLLFVGGVLPANAPTQALAPAQADEPSAYTLSLPIVVKSTAYDCSGNYYNCSDFTSQEQAQTVYDYCIANGYGDVHKLDWDKDGIACEALPASPPTPTFTPTPIPGDTPTPTEVPGGPTREPTEEPTEEPTKEPTEEPTEEPIEEPTEESTEAVGE